MTYTDHERLASRTERRFGAGCCCDRRCRALLKTLPEKYPWIGQRALVASDRSSRHAPLFRGDQEADPRRDGVGRYTAPVSLLVGVVCRRFEPLSLHRCKPLPQPPTSHPIEEAPSVISVNRDAENGRLRKGLATAEAAANGKGNPASVEGAVVMEGPKDSGEASSFGSNGGDTCAELCPSMPHLSMACCDDEIARQCRCSRWDEMGGCALSRFRTDSCIKWRELLSAHLLPSDRTGSTRGWSPLSFQMRDLQQSAMARAPQTDAQTGSDTRPSGMGDLTYTVSSTCRTARQPF